MASWERFLGAMSWLQFRANLVVSLAFIFLPNSHDFLHDQAMIGPRSGHDRGLIMILGLHRSPSALVEAIPRRKLHDGGSIAPRSWFDRTAIVEFFHESCGPSDEASGKGAIEIHPIRNHEGDPPPAT